MSEHPASIGGVKHFLTEEQIELDRQRRQADWERVRSATDPVEAPAEVFDTRSLYEKLKTQHDAKKKEFEDTWAAKNSIRGLDEDETGFLSRIDQAKMDKQRELKRLEQEEIEELKKAQKEMEAAGASGRAVSSARSLITAPVVNKQKQLLTGIVKRKGTANEPTLKRPLETENDEQDAQPPVRLPRLLVSGGRLPGIGPAEGFSDSSDSNESSDDGGLSRYSSGIDMESSLAQRKKLIKQLQDIAAASTGGGE